MCPLPPMGSRSKIVTHHGSVRVEEVVGWVGELGESLDTAASQKSAEAPDQPNVASVEAPRPARTITPSTPAARRRAGELGIDLATVNGSGPRGRITEEDVEREQQFRLPLQSQPTTPAASSDVPCPTPGKPSRTSTLAATWMRIRWLCGAKNCALRKFR